MSKLLQIFTLAGITCFALTTAPAAQAQDKQKDKLGEYDEIIIKRNSNKDGKVTIEIKDGEVLVDGQKMDAYKDGDISVYRRRIRPVDGNTFNFGAPHRGLQFFNDDDGNDNDAFSIRPGKAVLGVITEKKEAGGVTVKEVSPGSPAEKAGIKPGDVITMVDADKIEEPKDLFEKIGTHEPGDKVTVTYLHDQKENKTTVQLDERKGIGSMELFSPGQDNFFPRVPRNGMGFGDGFRRFGDNNDVRLGLSVQDTDNGDGAKVLGVTEGSAAEKAGFREGDIITELAGTAVSTAGDVTNAYRENKSQGNITAKIKRNGQEKTLKIQVPKRLNKADL